MGQRREKQADEVFCSSCGEPIKKEAELCPHCGVRNQHTPGGSNRRFRRTESRRTESRRAEVRTPEEGGSMLEDAVQYPFRGTDAGTTVLVGGVLSFLWFLLFVPTVFVFGYLVRVLTTTADGEESPPRFTDWAGLGIDGVVGTVFVVVFYLIPVGVFVAITGVGTLTGNADLATAGTALAALVSVPLFLVLVYVFPAVLSEFTVGYRGESRFRTDRVASAVTSSSYLFAWLIGFGIQVAASVALFFVFLIPLVGLSVILVGPFVGFVANVAAFRAFGVAYRSAAPSRG